MKSQRREEIRKILESKPFVSLRELTLEFPDVSEMTIRRDIEFFEREGEVIRVHGGARSVKFISRTDVDSISKRESENVPQKQAIARLAVEFLEPGRSIFLDSGSTTRQIPPYIPNERFSFTTTDPKLALDLSRAPVSVVNVVGGRLEKDNQTVTGLQATRFLSGVNIDTAILSPAGFSLENGFTVGSYNECELKRIVVEKARSVIVLIDSAKFDKSLPYTFCDMSDVDAIVTDGPVPLATRSAAQNLGVRIIEAGDAE